MNIAETIVVRVPLGNDELKLPVRLDDLIYLVAVDKVIFARYIDKDEVRYERVAGDNSTSLLSMVRKHSVLLEAPFVKINRGRIVNMNYHYALKGDVNRGTHAQLLKLRIPAYNFEEDVEISRRQLPDVKNYIKGTGLTDTVFAKNKHIE